MYSIWLERQANVSQFHNMPWQAINYVAYNLAIKHTARVQATGTSLWIPLAFSIPIPFTIHLLTQFAVQSSQFGSTFGRVPSQKKKERNKKKTRHIKKEKGTNYWYGYGRKTAACHIKFTPNKLHNKVIKAFNQTSVPCFPTSPPCPYIYTAAAALLSIGHKNVHKPSQTATRAATENRKTGVKWEIQPKTKGGERMWTGVEKRVKRRRSDSTNNERSPKQMEKASQRMSYPVLSWAELSSLVLHFPPISHFSPPPQSTLIWLYGFNIRRLLTRSLCPNMHMNIKLFGHFAEAKKFCTWLWQRNLCCMQQLEWIWVLSLGTSNHPVTSHHRVTK